MENQLVIQKSEAVFYGNDLITVSKNCLLSLKLLQTWTGHCAMAQTPPSTNTQKSPSKKIEKFPKLFNCPKRICNNPNPNPAMLQFRSFFTGMRAGVQPTLDPSAETF